VTDLIRNKYKALTPIVIRFISVAQSFFGKAGSSFAKLTNIQDRVQGREMQEVQPQSVEPEPMSYQDRYAMYMQEEEKQPAAEPYA
jgi:hypothetical protein